MAGRVRVRLSRGERRVETSALLNSGFETDSPDVVVPIGVAKALGVWPPKAGALISMETGGGEVEAYLIEGGAQLELLLEDRRVEPILVNLVINPAVREVIISDYVASMLGIVLLDFKRGLWRLSDEDKVRHSVEAEEWF